MSMRIPWPNKLVIPLGGLHRNLKNSSELKDILMDATVVRHLEHKVVSTSIMHKSRPVYGQRTGQCFILMSNIAVGKNIFKHAHTHIILRLCYVTFYSWIDLFYYFFTRNPLPEYNVIPLACSYNDLTPSCSCSQSLPNLTYLLSSQEKKYFWQQIFGPIFRRLWK